MNEKVENPVFEAIRKCISENRAFLFMKGTPEAPMCGFSAQVVSIMNNVGFPYGSYDVLSDPDMRQAIKDFSDWPTIPQLYVKGEFVGGCDIVTEMFQNGELQKLLND